MSFMNRPITAWGTACALTLALPVYAQQAPDSSRVAAARKALEAGGTIDVMIAGIQANLPAQRAAAPQLPAEFWTRFEERILKDAPQLLDSIAVLYARHLSRQELDAITAFYQSPAGQRLRALQPTLVAEGAVIGQRWGFRIGAEVGASIQRQ